MLYTSISSYCRRNKSINLMSSLKSRQIKKLSFLSDTLAAPIVPTVDLEVIMHVTWMLNWWNLTKLLLVLPVFLNTPCQTALCITTLHPSPNNLFIVPSTTSSMQLLVQIYVHPHPLSSICSSCPEYCNFNFRTLLLKVTFEYGSTSKPEHRDHLPSLRFCRGFLQSLQECV
jgi:hypothetical protein